MKLGILFIFPFLVLLSTACENVDKNSIGNLSKNGISAPRSIDRLIKKRFSTGLQVNEK
jgi:hypothetical protein